MEWRQAHPSQSCAIKTEQKSNHNGYIWFTDTALWIKFDSTLQLVFLKMQNLLPISHGALKRNVNSKLKNNSN